jgi:hypothetical protein
VKNNGIVKFAKRWQFCVTAARLRPAGTALSTKRYLNIEPLKESAAQPKLNVPKNTGHLRVFICCSGITGCLSATATCHVRAMRLSLAPAGW